MVMDNHSFIIVYIKAVSPVREQFFRLAHISIRILQLSLLESSHLSLTAYSCVPNNS